MQSLVVNTLFSASGNWRQKIYHGIAAMIWTITLVNCVRFTLCKRYSNKSSFRERNCLFFVLYNSQHIWCQDICVIYGLSHHLFCQNIFIFICIVLL